MKNTKRILALVLAAMLMLALAGCSGSDYKAAGELYMAGDYKAASEKYAALGDYKDSADLAVKSDYMYARELYYAGAYEAAAMDFNALGDYEDCKDMATECIYKLAVETFNAGKYADAIEIFLEVEDYEDSEDFISRARDAIMRESVLGEWKCVQNLDEQFTEGFATGFADSSNLDPSDYFTFEGLEVVYLLTLNDDGTYSLDVDKEAFDKCIDGINGGLVEGLKNMIADLLEEEAAAYGYTLDGLLKAVGADSIDELITISLGMDPEAYVEVLMAEGRADVLFEDYPQEGTFTLSGTTVSFSGQGDAEYNVVLEELVFSEKVLNTTFESMTFTR